MNWMNERKILAPPNFYDGMRVIQERNLDDDLPEVSYTRGSDLSGSFEGAGGIGGLLARSHGYNTGNGGWSTHNFYHADGNGNVTYLVNSSQGLAASYRYDAYGNTLSKSGGLADANVYRFSSKESVRHEFWNVELYYYGYRFYVPNIQRWLNRDPIEEESNFKQAVSKYGQNKASLYRLDSIGNLYGFVHNNPILYGDVDGRFLAIPAAGGVIIGIGQGVTVGFGICMLWPPCRQALIDKAKKVADKCVPSNPPQDTPKDDCDSKLLDCLNNRNQPDNDYGTQKDCRSCYNECLNDGSWPSYKCAD
jgi:RHS repeat-associated protein